ncbi:MAG: restriction endonuclease [Candidatus Buchananbacteria bacterium]|nr:restriction endonuclease [Candidatus Buchananbacteria bacterium]
MSEKIKKTIKQMLKPVKRIPFDLVIETISGKKVIPFDEKNKKDSKLLTKLDAVAKMAGVEVNKNGIKRTRPNEVGNDIEPYVKKALNDLGYKADIPITTLGGKQSSGYPDVEFIDEFGRTNYLECKTFNIENVNTSFRSFYFSPSEKFKITKDAHHFILSFEIYVEKSEDKNNVYKCKSYKILSAENLMVNVKYEFNASNSDMYIEELILTEGKL